MASSPNAALLVLVILLVAAMFEASGAAGPPACNPTGNIGRLLACQASAVKNGKNPKAVKGCCDAVKPFSGSKAAANCLCQSLLAAKKLDPNVDLPTAVGIPAKCGMAVLPGLKCNGIVIPQH